MNKVKLGLVLVFLLAFASIQVVLAKNELKGLENNHGRRVNLNQLNGDVTLDELEAVEAENFLQGLKRIPHGKGCWKDKPKFIPGKDLGFFIWQGKCAKFWFVVWSGDAKLYRNITNATEEEANETNDTNALMPGWHVMEGTITSTGPIYDLATFYFDKHRNSSFDVLETKINRDGIFEASFKGLVGPHMDGIAFHSKGEVLTLDLKVDGVPSTNLIYIGKNATNPPSIPFELRGPPGPNRIKVLVHYIEDLLRRR